MTSLTDRLRLIRWTGSDRWRNSDLQDNWAAIDAAPGTLICTSTTRPSDWGSNQTGRRIIETDTRLEYEWDGTGWQRLTGKGLVTRVQRTTAFSTTSLSYVSVLATASTSVTSRRHLVVVEAPRIYSTAGLTSLAIFRDGTKLQEWLHQGSTGAPAANQPRPLFAVTTDQPAEGSSIYSLQMSAVTGYGGTCWMECGVNSPCAITLVEA
jgi:hypothetical protein